MLEFDTVFILHFIQDWNVRSASPSLIFPRSLDIASAFFYWKSIPMLSSALRLQCCPSLDSFYNILQILFYWRRKKARQESAAKSKTSTSNPLQNFVVSSKFQPPESKMHQFWTPLWDRPNKTQLRSYWPPFSQLERPNSTQHDGQTIRLIRP